MAVPKRRCPLGVRWKQLPVWPSSEPPPFPLRRNSFYVVLAMIGAHFKLVTSEAFIACIVLFPFLIPLLHISKNQETNTTNSKFTPILFLGQRLTYTTPTKLHSQICPLPSHHSHLITGTTNSTVHFKLKTRIGLHDGLFWDCPGSRFEKV